jgi:hypothetical protein
MIALTGSGYRFLYASMNSRRAQDQTGQPNAAANPGRPGMDARQIVNQYYTAWQQRAGDMAGAGEQLLLSRPGGQFR